MGETYRSALTTAKIMTGTVAVTQGQSYVLGKYTVQAGEMIQLGWGGNSSQEGAEGRIFIDIRDNTASPGAIKDGIVRFTVYSPQGRPLRILGEYRTETLRTDKANRTLQVPFPSTSFPAVSEDKYIAIEFIPDAASTISNTNTIMLFDTTNYVV